MTRKDIRRGTLVTMAFVVICVAAIAVIVGLRTGEEKKSVGTAKVQAANDWMANLTNESSDYIPLAPMDAMIERFMGKWSVKGMSLAVTRNDSLLYTKGYGWADQEAGIPMGPRNIMRMASASKLVTAIAIMKLKEEGKLTLDTKVFGPEGILNDTSFTNAMIDLRMQDITVDHLLRHQGGFGRGAGDPMFNTNDIIKAKRLSSPPSNEDLVRIVLGRRIAFAPGEGRIYSNFGYMVLSMVVERLTGMSYWDYVTEHVLEPAGCHGFRPATNYYSERNADEVKYYGPDDEKVEEWNGSGRMVDRVYGGSNVNGLMGAGGWCASSADLARLVAATDKYPYVKNVLGKASIDSLTAYAEKEKLSRGWSETDAKGKWTRTGTLSSTHALIQRFPDGECWVLLTNSGVWTGHHFSHDMMRLVDRLRSSYSDKMPRRDLFRGE